MKYVAIEYQAPGTNKSYKGFLRIPDDFPGNWAVGFVNYIRDKYNLKPSDTVYIYPIRVYLAPELSPPKYTDSIPDGYEDMYEDFNQALRSSKYYPPCNANDSIRRQWSLASPINPDYVRKFS